MSLSRVLQTLQNFDLGRQNQTREKSPQSKFFDKIQNSVDQIDKKIKQIQVIFIVNSIVCTELVLPDHAKYSLLSKLMITPFAQKQL